MRFMILSAALVFACKPVTPASSVLPPTAPENQALAISSDVEPAEEAPAINAEEPAPAEEAPTPAPEEASAPEIVEPPSQAPLVVDPLAEPEPEPEEPQASPSAPAPSAWSGSQWNRSQPRVVSILHHTQPPRAILNLPNGDEVVVSPGDMLPELRLVIMAIGADLVQLAEVTPVGDHTEIREFYIHPLYKGAGNPAGIQR